MRALVRACDVEADGETGWFELLSSTGISIAANLASVFVMERHVRCRRPDSLEQGTEQMDRARTYPRRDVGRSFRFPLPSRMRVSFGDGHPTHPRRGSGTTSSAAWTSHSRSLEHERFRPSLSHRDFQAKISRFSAWEGSRFRSRSIEISREIDRDFEAEASRFQRGRDRDFEGKGSRFRERSEGTEGNEGDGETWSGIGRVRRKQ